MLLDKGEGKNILRTLNTVTAMERCVKTFVSNIPWAADAKQLAMFLEARVGAGAIYSVEIKRNSENGRSKGQAVVHFEDQDSALKAVQLPEYGRRFLNRPIHIKLVDRDIVHKPKHNLITVERGSLSIGYLKKDSTMLVLWSSSSKAVTTDVDFNSRRVRYSLTVNEATEYKLEFHFKDIFSLEPTTIPRATNFYILMQVLKLYPNDAPGFACISSFPSVCIENDEKCSCSMSYPCVIHGNFFLSRSITHRGFFKERTMQTMRTRLMWTSCIVTSRERWKSRG